MRENTYVHTVLYLLYCKMSQFGQLLKWSNIISSLLCAQLKHPTERSEYGLLVALVPLIFHSLHLLDHGSKLVKTGGKYILPYGINVLVNIVPPFSQLALSSYY